MEKPNWFDLENYRSLEQFNLKEWWVQLELRRDIRDFFSYGYSTNTKYEKFVTKVVEEIKKSGIVKTYLVELENIGSPLKPTVRDISALEIFSSSSLIQSKMPHNCYSDESFDNLLSGIDCTFNESKGHLLINLDASDEQLKRDFGNWLKTKKRPSSIYKNKTNFNTRNIESWIDMRLLPFIDLSIIFEAENIPYNIEDFGRWLFSDGTKYQDRENLLKTIRTRANWLIDSSTLSQMITQLENF
ncbi:DUF6387 family protein [Methylomarinum vadi]|uniref:DUF6387 family protein n=1 Tax=Methylomarinum vadi TaxID=438855 RepID=UPI0004DEE8B2|nr:DUF6387 family protein [Methylomarinum vadi]